MLCTFLELVSSFNHNHILFANEIYFVCNHTHIQCKWKTQHPDKTGPVV